MTHIYAHLWNKYRPAILQLMLASASGPQQYRFFDHEFKGINPKERNHSFELQVFQGRATNNIKNSATASDLLGILNMSAKAVELMDKHRFEFILDKKFVLHVSRVAQPEETIQPAE